MSAEHMILTVLATKLAQAVATDNDNPDGHDIASGLYGPAVSEWLREVAKELAPAAEQVEPKAVWRFVGAADSMRRPEECDLVGGETDMPAAQAAEQAVPVAWPFRCGQRKLVRRGHAQGLLREMAAWMRRDGVGDCDAVELVSAYIDAIEAAPPAPARQDWQPIETAPKDQFILVSCPSGYTTIPRVSTIAIMHSDYKVGRWVDHANDDLTDWGMVPTHWQPRPADPADGGV